MPSCSSSSNIMSSVTSVNLNSIGSRILATIPLTSSDYSISSDIVAGDVIRYDVTNPSSKQYVQAKADNAENAEVVGVVESIDSDSMNVVIFGQIEFPDGRFNNIGTPADGASGGNDIYFLSPSTAGDVQNLAPSNETEVIKPILQTMDDGSNNAVVLNYIGYSVGGELASNDNSDSLIGTVLNVVDGADSVIPPNFIEVSSKSQSLKITEYPDAYAYFGKTYGFTEVITLDSSTKISSTLSGGNATQITARANTYNARIISVDSVNNKVTVERSGGGTEVDTSKSLKINGRNYTISSSVVESFTIPRVTSPNEFRFDVDGDAKTVEVKTYMKVKNIRGVTIPEKVTVRELEVTNKLTTQTASAAENDDLNDAVNTLNTEVTNIKNKLGIS